MGAPQTNGGIGNCAPFNEKYWRQSNENKR